MLQPLGRVNGGTERLDVGCSMFSILFLQPGVIVAGFVHVGADAEMRARPVEIERHDDVPRNAERLHQFRDQVLGLRLAFAQQETLDVQRINNQVAGGGHNFLIWFRRIVSVVFIFVVDIKRNEQISICQKTMELR